MHTQVEYERIRLVCFLWSNEQQQLETLQRQNASYAQNKSHQEELIKKTNTQLQEIQGQCETDKKTTQAAHDAQKTAEEATKKADDRITQLKKHMIVLSEQLQGTQRELQTEKASNETEKRNAEAAKDAQDAAQEATNKAKHRISELENHILVLRAELEEARGDSHNTKADFDPDIKNHEVIHLCIHAMRMLAALPSLMYHPIYCLQEDSSDIELSEGPVKRARKGATKSDYAKASLDDYPYNFTPRLPPLGWREHAMEAAAAWVAAGAPAQDNKRVVYDKHGSTEKNIVIGIVSAWCVLNEIGDPFHYDRPYSRVKRYAIEIAMSAMGNIKNKNDRRGTWHLTIVAD